MSEGDSGARADDELRSARRAGVAGAIALGLVLVTLVLLFALEFHLVAAFMRKCVRSLAVFQQLDRH